MEKNEFCYLFSPIFIVADNTKFNVSYLDDLTIKSDYFYDEMASYFSFANKNVFKSNLEPIIDPHLYDYYMFNRLKIENELLNDIKNNNIGRCISQNGTYLLAEENNYKDDYISRVDAKDISATTGKSCGFYLMPIVYKVQKEELSKIIEIQNNQSKRIFATRNLKHKIGDVSVFSELESVLNAFIYPIIPGDNILLLAKQAMDVKRALDGVG